MQVERISNWTDATAKELTPADLDIAQRTHEFMAEYFEQWSSAPSLPELFAYLRGRRVVDWPERES